MNIPPVLDRKTLASLASPDETHAVRVVLLKVNNSGVYRLKQKRYTYMFERDGNFGAHILDFPASVWMANTPVNAYRDNFSLSHDFQHSETTPFVIQIIPWGDAVATAQAKEIPPMKANPLPLLRTLMEKLDAPIVMIEAMTFADSGNIEELQRFVESVEVAEEADDFAPNTDPDEEHPVDAPLVDDNGPVHAEPETVISTTGEKTETPAARRMREYRARKKASKSTKPKKA